MKKLGDEKKRLEQSKSHFLPEKIPGAFRHAEIYALDQEFAKSKKNRSLKYLAVFSLFLAMIIGGSIFLIYVNQKLKPQSTALFSETDELELKNLLKDANNDQSQLQQLEKQLQQLKERYRQTEQRLKNDPSAWQNEKQDLEKQIAETQARIMTLQNKLAATQSQIKTNLQNAQSQINNTDVMMQMKLDKQRQEYEEKLQEQFLLYNPQFQEKNLTELLKKNLNAPLSISEKQQHLGEFDSVLARENILQRSDFDKALQDVLSFDNVANRLHKVPYKNSVSLALPLLHEQKTNIAQKFDVVLQRSSQRLKEKNALIESYRFALQNLAKSQNEAGYVIDARNKQRILLHIHESYIVQAAAKAKVFRRDDDYIAEISIAKVGSHFYGSVVSLKKEIQPFDKIVLDLQ